MEVNRGAGRRLARDLGAVSRGGRPTGQVRPAEGFKSSGLERQRPAIRADNANRLERRREETAMEGKADRMADELAGPRPGRTVGEDLRRRAVAAVLERGMSFREAALKFEVGVGSVYRWVQRYRQRGNVRADPRRRPPSRIEQERERVFRLLKQRPKLTIPALQRALAAEGVTVSAATVQRFLERHGLQRTERLARRRKWAALRPPDRA